MESGQMGIFHQPLQEGKMKLRVMPVFFMTERENAEADLETIKGLLPKHCELTAPALVDGWDGLEALQDRTSEADVFLELSANIRLVPVRLLLRLADFGLPIILYGTEFVPGARRLEAAGYWRARGLKVSLPLDRTGLRAQLTLMAAKLRIERTKALLIGPHMGSPFVVTSLPDPKMAQRTLGVEILACEPSQLLDFYRMADGDQVKRLANDWVQAAESIQEPKDSDLHKSARFHLAVRGLLEEYEANAFAINCIPLVEELQATPCLALVRMNDEGIPAACEGDLTALMSMIVMERLADRPTFMGNIVYVNPEERVIEVNHCVLPLRVCGYDEPTKPYVLRDYHGRNMGVTAAWTPDLERDVTVARFDADLKEFVFVRGELIGYGEDYCRSNLRIKLDNVRGFMDQIRGNHHIIAYGDHGKQIVDLCQEFGIVPVSPGDQQR